MKRRLLLTALLVALAATTAASQMRRATFQALTVSTSAVGLAATTIDPADGTGQMRQCRGHLETADVRYRFDGVAPTATVGVLLRADEVITLADAVVAKQIRFIRDTAAMADATLSIHCWR